MEDDLRASCNYIWSSVGSILSSGDRDFIKALHVEMRGLMNLLAKKNGRPVYSESVPIVPTVRIYKKI